MQAEDAVVCGHPTEEPVGPEALQMTVHNMLNCRGGWHGWSGTLKSEHQGSGCHPLSCLEVNEGVPSGSPKSERMTCRARGEVTDHEGIEDTMSPRALYGRDLSKTDASQARSRKFDHFSMPAFGEWRH